MWRTLIRRLDARWRGRSPADRVEADVWATVGRTPRPESALLSQIEKTALQVYADHGLPTREGHYRRGPREKGWSFLGDDLPPEARWGEMLERPPEAGWRYGALRDLGRSGPPEVKAAAGLLAACDLLREKLVSRGPHDAAEQIEVAIRLGADWRALDIQRTRAGARLQLTPPGNAVPTPAREPATRRSGRGKRQP